MARFSFARVETTSIASGCTGATRWWALVIGVVAVGFDLVAAGDWSLRPERAALAALACAALAGLPGQGWASVGWTLQARPEWYDWLDWSFFAGLLVVFATVAISILYMGWGGDRPLAYVGPPSDHPDAILSPWIWWYIPVVEEVLYRAVLCVALVPWLGARWTVVVAAFVFAGLHQRYGVFALNHFFAGLVLSWAFLRSGTLLLPILLHWIGNTLVYGLTWYLHAATAY